MKKLVSWTQTYGDERLLNLQLLNYDILGNYIRNKCSYIIFSFHNCSDIFYNNSKEIIENLYCKEKLILLRFNNISYLQCYKNIIEKTKQLNCSDILQIQDDQHGINNNENVKNLENISIILELYKSNENIKHLHLFGEESIPKKNLQPIEIINKNNIELYKYNSTDFQKCNIFAWNDGTYIIDINLIDKLLNIKNIPHDVWRLEIYLKNIYDNNIFHRWGSNKILFKASNLFGKNINYKISKEENLIRFFGETNKWNEIKNLIK